MGLAAQKKKGDREQRRNDIRRRLLKAIEELAAGGESYSNVTIERLATAAGLSRATFYIYFEGKGDLLRAWFSETLEDLREACSGWREIDASPSPAELGEALRQIIVTYRKHATLMAAINDEATQDRSLRDRLSDAIERSINAVRSHIERGQEQGWIDPELLPAETAAWAIWMMERGLTQIVPTASTRQLRVLAETLTDMAWHTFYAGGRQT
jgi:AcrR family transcriptional regulator